MTFTITSGKRTRVKNGNINEKENNVLVKKYVKFNSTNNSMFHAKILTNIFSTSNFSNFASILAKQVGSNIREWIFVDLTHCDTNYQTFPKFSRKTVS